MADILSKDELTALQHAVSKGEVETGLPLGSAAGVHARVTPYDFLRPATVPEKQSGVVQLIHERFARLFGNALTGYLNLICDVKFLSVEQMPYSEFEPTIPKPCTLALAGMDPFDGKVLMALHPMLGFAIVDRILGGTGAVSSEPRPFTEIEQLITDEIVSLAVVELQKAWQTVAPMTLALQERHSNAQLVNYVPAEEMIVVATIEARIRETSGLLTVCYPFRVLEYLGKTLRKGAVQGGEGLAKRPRGNEEICREVTHVPLEVTACLGRSVIQIREILNLQPGDVLLINRQIQDELDLKVGARVRYRGYLGMYRDKMAFAISQRM